MDFQRRVRYPIPPNFIDFALKTLPFTLGLIASIMRISDYVLSGALLRAANVLPNSDTFDFIVVGSGPSGSAVAARLSENPNVRVLLVEAGGHPSPFSSFPIATVNLLQHPDLDWSYKTVSQNACALGLVNHEVSYPRGIGLGGCSNLNFMIYMKGNPRDFDRWAEITEDSRWKYDNVEKYFRKIEDYHGVWREFGQHGVGGPLRIERAQYTPGLGLVLDAAKELGFEVRDLNHDQRPGFSPLDFTQKRGMRFSAYRAYIKPNLFRPNLVIYKYTLVTKVHFDENRKAIGISLIRHFVPGFAWAKKEIIICAGAINSPQLLMLSGIGPKDHLISHRIPPVVDLPAVGNNLQDHVTTVLGPFFLNDSASFILHRDFDVGALYNFAVRGNGPVTSPMGVMAMGLASSSLAPSPQWPDLMLTVASQGIFKGLAQLIDGKFNLGKTAQSYLSGFENKDAHFVLISLGLPKSRGYVRLKNTNPHTKPLINPRYYSNPDDAKVMLEGMDLVLKLYENTTSMKRVAAALSTRSLPGCEHVPFRSPSYFDCYLKTLTVTLFHPSSTCAMGKGPNAVVDSELRVFGVKGLRIADASVIPTITNANLQMPCFLIGEVVSDMIKATWNL